jgi:hypothetical protein
MTNDSESFEKKGLDFNTAAGPQAFGDSVVSKRHRELAEAILRGSGSSSAWCSAHNVSTAAGRMFEDPGLLRLLQPGALGVWNNNQAGQFNKCSLQPTQLSPT